MHRLRHFAMLLAAVRGLAQVPTAGELLAKARAALEENDKREPHWNWTSTEVTTVLNGSGRELQRLPVVTVESVIRKDGRRCNAVLSWGDGTPPYKVNEDADARCSGQDPVAPPLSVRSLLKSANATVLAASAESYQVAIHHDKARTHDAQHEVRCAASVEGVIKLDRATMFPVHVEGKLVDSGCESLSEEELHYGEEPLGRPIPRAMFKGTTFRMEFSQQQDRYGNPANSYWISTAQHWFSPVGRAANVIFHNRKFALTPMLKSGFLVKDLQTTAQEFGVQSSTRFDSIPK
jgi:hypothetical protein